MRPSELCKQEGKTLRVGFIDDILGDSYDVTYNRQDSPSNHHGTKESLPLNREQFDRLNVKVGDPVMLYFELNASLLSEVLYGQNGEVLYQP